LTNFIKSIYNNINTIKIISLMSKKTLEGTNRKAIRKSGFRARMKTATGRRVIKQRRRKGRKRLSISSK